MPKPVQVPASVGWRALSRPTRRQAIQEGWHDYQCRGWEATPRYGLDDPRRWLWQNGMEGAEAARRNVSFEPARVQGWN